MSAVMHVYATDDPFRMAHKSDFIKFGYNPWPGIVLSYIQTMSMPDKNGKTKLKTFKLGHFWMVWSYKEIARDVGCTYAIARHSIRVLKAHGLIAVLFSRIGGHPKNHIRLLPQDQPDTPRPQLALVKPPKKSNDSTKVSNSTKNSNEITEVSKGSVTVDTFKRCQESHLLSFRESSLESEKEDPLPPQSGGEDNSLSLKKQEEEKMPEPEKINGTVGKVLGQIKQGTPPSPPQPFNPPPSSSADRGSLRPAPAPVPANRREFNTNLRALNRSPRQLGQEAWEAKRIEEERIMEEKNKERASAALKKIKQYEEDAATPESQAIFDEEMKRVQAEFPDMGYFAQQDLAYARKEKEIQAAKRKRS